MHKENKITMQIKRKRTDTPYMIIKAKILWSIRPGQFMVHFLKCLCVTLIHGYVLLWIYIGYKKPKTQKRKMQKKLKWRKEKIKEGRLSQCIFFFFLSHSVGLVFILSRPTPRFSFSISLG